MIEHKKKFGIYLWDTFDNETIFIDEADTIQEAQLKVNDKYGNKISGDGADRIEIVDSKGNIIEKIQIR